MSWTPISGTVPQYQQSTGDLASAYYLKAYAAGTSTAINMATDSTGGTTLDKIQINSSGYPVNSSGGVIIPHVSQAYKLVLYKNSTDADNNTTANADWVIDSLAQSAAAVSSQNVEIEYQNGSAATANKFTLASLVYTVGVNNLAIFENGQRLRLGSSYDYTETSSTEVTLTYTPLDNAVYTFVQGETTTSTVSDASAVTYTPAGSGAVATNVQAKLREGVSVKDFGAVGDGVTDDTTAIQAALTAVGDHGSVFVPIGVYKTTSEVTLSNEGQRLYGENQRGSIIYYTGTGIAVRTTKVAQEVSYLHITSLDPDTSGHLTTDNAGSGTGDVGIQLEHVDGHIHHNTISYFNSATLKSSAIKTNGTVGFSNNIHDNYIRYCWGGVSLEDTITDTTVRDNTILDVEKYGVSVGYDWDAAAQTSFTGDNFRIENNLIQNVCRNKSSGGGVGDGYGVALFRGATISVRGNYIEDVYAQSGSTAYSIYGDGTSGDRLLAVDIGLNNAVTGFTGTSYSVWIDNAWYGGGSLNHFDSGNGQVELGSGAKYYEFGVNFFTGAPATPYTLNGATNRAYDAVTGKTTSNSGATFEIDYGQRLSGRTINTENTLTVNSAAPDVSGGNQFVTANTSPTTYNNFNGTDGQTILVIFKDANSTVDFTGTSLKGNVGVDWSPSNGDHMTCTRSGGNWYCTISDNTV